MWKSDKWKEYELLDTSDGERLERWGNCTLVRPDPQVVWKDCRKNPMWNKADGIYKRSSSGGGGWKSRGRLKQEWYISYDLEIGKKLTFMIKPTGFKHTGLFPEQAANWEWLSNLIRKRTEAGGSVKVLNLFAYTGGATVAALEAGAEVVHVDASKGMVTWAKENVVSSGLDDRPVRSIVDDVVKFVQRENRRGRQYDAIIMDPPSYGRGPSGEVWKIENELYPLIEECMKILSDKPLFFLINSYTTGLSAQVLINVLSMTVGRKYGGKITADEIGLTMKSNNLVLPCGISGRWQEHSTK